MLLICGLFFFVIGIIIAKANGLILDLPTAEAVPGIQTANIEIVIFAGFGLGLMGFGALVLFLERHN